MAGGEAGAGWLGMLIGVILTVRRTTGDREVPAACWASGRLCAVETAVEGEEALCGADVVKSGGGGVW